MMSASLQDQCLCEAEGGRLSLALKRQRSAFTRLFRVIVSVLLIVFLVRSMDIRTLLDTLKAIKLSYLALGIGLNALQIVLTSYKWQMLLATQEIRVPLGKLVSLYLLGYFFSNFMPSSFGGDIVRVYGLSTYTNRMADSIVSVFMDRLSGFLALLVIATTALALEFRELENQSLAWFIGGLALLFIILGILFAFAGDILGRLIAPLKAVSRYGIARRAIEVYNAFHRYKQYKRTMLFVMAISVVFQITAIVIAFVISLSLGLRISLRHFFLFIPVITILTMMPISIGGIGVQDGGYVYLFGGIGIGTPAALSMSLLWHASRLFFGLLGGLINTFEHVKPILTKSRQ